MFRAGRYSRNAQRQRCALKRHGDGHLADIRCYAAKEGLKLTDKAGREWCSPSWMIVGLCAQAGRIRPKGFPRRAYGHRLANRL